MALIMSVHYIKTRPLSIKWLIRKQNLLEHWKTLLIDLFSLVGAAITILSIYVSDRKDWGQMKWSDIIVFGIVIFILIIWGRKSWETLESKTLELNKDLFFKYIAEEVKKASATIECIAGDASWLRDQRDTYKYISEHKPEVKINIYYSTEAHKRYMKLIREYAQWGINMIPYPFKFETEYLKGVLIDSDENAKFYSIKKEENGCISTTKFNAGCYEYCLAVAFIKNIDAAIKNKKKNKVIIGIAGLNNIGKTSLCRKIRQQYKEQVVLIDDTFINTENETSFEVALFCLTNQILEYLNSTKRQTDKDKPSIILFDRTPFDNLMFLKRYRPKDKYGTYTYKLESLLRIFMSNFTHIIFLCPDKKLTNCSTSFINEFERKELTRSLDKIYGIIKEKITKVNVHYSVNEESFSQQIDELSQQVSQIIDDHLKPDEKS